MFNSVCINSAIKEWPLSLRAVLMPLMFLLYGKFLQVVRGLELASLPGGSQLPLPRVQIMSR